ncbi:MAG: UvrD-helicase domain-containing protein, partial [Solirubrobacteraceae bacterium]
MSHWTDEQCLAIERRSGDLLLDAAAGSGKTSVLVERFVESVLSDGVDVTAILAITFTDKAAGELRDRIRARLVARGAPEQARRTEDAFISTIHGFCARVLRSGALVAGLEPRFTVLDSDQTRPLAAAAFEDALAQLHRKRPDAVELVAAYGAPALREAILSVHARLRSAGATRPRLPAAPEISTGRLAEAAGAQHRAAATVAAELETVVSPGPMVTQALERARACARVASAAGEDAPWPPELQRLVLPRNGAALSTDACAAYATALHEFRELCAERAAAPVRDGLDQLLELFGERYEARKQAVGGLDFSDLELLAATVLREDQPLRQRWSQRFERIMVDELQDTNRVQLQLIESIARDNLFTVGDARQSIYAFRHADVELSLP